MARNDVYININSLSPADAVVTGQQDMTAATIPELVLGDTPTFNFYFTDNTNVWPSWAGNAAYTVTWALSDAVSGDFSPAATTGNATPITGGWSIVLPLNAYDLVGLLNTKRVSQPYPVTNLWQQIRVADPSGNEVTRAMFWTPIRYRAISDTQNTESASPTGGREVTVDNVNVLTTPTAAQFYAANPVPTSALGSAANGELLIGNGTGFTKSTLTAGTGITVTNGSGSITIDASGAQETLTATVKNAESVAITKGQVVYLFGATGNMPSVKLAYNTSDATSAKTFGVVSSSSIAANGTGLVTCVGVVDGLNLGAYQDGDTLYLGATPGSVTATKPYAPNHLVYVGIVERANAGNGELYVKVQNGYELDEIHDVQINAPRQSGQTLIYDNTTSLWKNARITAGSNIAVTNGDGSITIGFSGTLPVANGGTGVTTSTGSGSVVLSTSPTLTTPILGTPQSGTLSSCTGLPISTGVSGLGTNVATFLATPSSANLASAVTDETGTGALVFANTPTLVTPNIGAATGTSVNLSGAGTFGGNLTVSGNINPFTIGPGYTGFAGSIGILGGNGLFIQGKTGTTYDFAVGNNASSVAFGIPAGTTNVSVAGNLTVSGGTITGGASGMSLASGGTNQNITLTPNGTGRVNFANGQITLTNGNSQLLSTGNIYFDAGGGGNLLLRTGNVLVGGTVDGGQKLQVAGTAAISSNLTVSGTGVTTLGATGARVLVNGATDDSSTNLQVSGNSTLGSISVQAGPTTYASYKMSFTAQAADEAYLVKFGTYKILTGEGYDTPEVTKLYSNNTLALTLSSTQAATLAGNLTVSGTGTSSVAGKWLIGTGGVDSGALLQVGTNTTTSAGGMVFGTDCNLYRSASGTLSVSCAGTFVLSATDNGASDPQILAAGGKGTRPAYSFSGDNNTGLFSTVADTLYFATGGTTALTLDSSQNATFAGTITSGNIFAKRSDNTGVIRLIATSGVSAGSDIESFNAAGSSWNRLNFRSTVAAFYTGASANTLALTVDDSQRTILAGALRLNNAYTAGAPTATGYVTIQDSAGNTYKVLVGT